MLTFISFWRAAAIVLCDLGSSAFYAGGIAEEAVGKAAPWFILGVMLFSFAVRAVYVESCSMFTRGGVYRVVKEALGGTFAKLSVSALMFDYILTGPISGVSAGQYITGLLNEMLVVAAGHNWLPSRLHQVGDRVDRAPQLQLGLLDLADELRLAELPVRTGLTARRGHDIARPGHDLLAGHHMLPFRVGLPNPDSLSDSTDPPDAGAPGDQAADQQRLW